MPEPLITTTTIKTLFDLLHILVNGRAIKREKTLNDILTPIYEQLANIHANYHKLYLTSANMLPIKDEHRWCIPGRDGYYEFEHSTIQGRIRHIKDEFEAYRSEIEYVRDAVRISAGQYLNSLKGEEERRFLFSVIQYFLEDRYALDANHIMDSYINSIMTNGGETVLGTPSSRLSLSVTAQAT